MADPTDFEVMMVELINRARSNPEGEFDALILSTDPLITVDPGITGALRFFDVDLDVLRAQLDGLPAAAALAWNVNLGDSADTHSQRMIDFDEQEHNFPGEPNLGQKLSNANYFGAFAGGENIFAFTDNPVQGHAGFYIDWGFSDTGIQDPAGHRNSILSANFAEVGVGMLEQTDPDADVGPFVVTQHFGNRFGRDSALTGVIIDDADADDFYSLGEGLGGVTITASGANGTFSTISFGAGIYTLELEDGTYEVTFSGGGLDANVVETVVIDGQNVKLDVERTGEIRLYRVGDEAAEHLAGTDGNDLLRGAAGDDMLTGGAGADHLDGGEGVDTADYSSAIARVRADLQGGLNGIGDAEGDTFENVENLIGTARNDDLRGDAGSNHIKGGSASDRLHGRAGDDVIEGDVGTDVLYGNAGRDIMSGGVGNDRFIYFGLSDSRVGVNRRDVITDFEDGDRIELQRLDADRGEVGNQVFTFIGQVQFSNQAGELRFFKSSGNNQTVIQADTNGDGVQDFQIELTGLIDLDEGDFIL
ncbi:MAG: CAP domain-containing protein [Pseudomonadota bacterium]